MIVETDVLVLDPFDVREKRVFVGNKVLLEHYVHYCVVQRAQQLADLGGGGRTVRVSRCPGGHLTFLFM